MSSYRKGARVHSLRWPDHHGTVVRVGNDDWVGVRWDGTSFEDQADLADVEPSKKPAPKNPGPGYITVRT